MTIRARLSLWYAGFLFASVMLIAVLGLQELREEQSKSEHRGNGTVVQEKLMREISEVVVIVGLPAALVALIGGWWLTRQALAPVHALTEAVARIQEHHLKEQLPRSGNGDELDRLTEVFNAMTARLDGSFQRIREFTLHASHELKTPLTVMHGELETALRDEALAPAQRENALSQLDEVQRLSKIVDGLTLLTKADAGQVALGRESVRLDELVRDAHADAQILAHPSGVQVLLTACDEISLTGDRHRLRQLLLNLTDNAIKHNQTGGTVSMELRRVEQTAEFTIANTGAGVPLDLQPRVFDRFFRADASHTSAVDGCGLGLSLAQWIATAHGGSIRFISEPGKLTTVKVSLPVRA